MRNRSEPRDFDNVFAELDGENDRAAILVGGSILEYALEQAIASRLREPQTTTESDALFDEHGILGSFHEKIWAAYFLKVIGPSVRRDLDLVRAIRNSAAHDMNAISFDGTSEIANRCRELRFADASIPGKANPPDLRGKFILTIRFFTANLLLRAGDAKAEIAEAAQQLAPYLDR